MASYTKNTNFATKDTLPTGDPAKVIKGTEINTEYDNIQTAVNSKPDANSGTHTGTTSMDTVSVSTSLTTADLSATGTSTIADADVTTLDVTGTSTISDADVTTLDVTGVSTLADADVSTLDVTGTSTLADADITTLDVSGVSTLVGDLTVDTNTLHVDSTNSRVGIGTAAPAYHLDLRPPTGDGIRLNDGVRQGRIDLTGSSDFYIATGTNHTLSLGVNNGITATVYSNGIQTNGATGFSPGANVAGTRIPTDGTAYFHTSRDGIIPMILHGYNQTGDLVFESFYYNASKVGEIRTDGSTTSYNTSSDYRLKENIQGIDAASTELKRLKPSEFNFIGSDKRVQGFIAHEVQEVVPEAVTGEKDGEEYQAMDASKLIPLLTASLQEALKRIEELEAKI